MRILLSPIKFITIAVLILFAACKKEAVDDTGGGGIEKPKPYHVTDFKITPYSDDLYKFDFEDTSKSVQSYWQFGDPSDNNTYSTKKLYFTYSQEGTYKVRLIAVSASGVRDTVYKSVEVKIPTPTAIIQAVPDEHDPSKIIFSCTTSDDVVQYDWNFKDGETSTIKNPGAHTYTSVGLRRVALTVTNKFRKPTTVTIDVYPKFITGVIIKKVQLTHTPTDNCPNAYFKFFSGNPPNLKTQSSVNNGRCINTGDECSWDVDFTLTNQDKFNFEFYDKGAFSDGLIGFLEQGNLRANYPLTVVSFGSNNSGQLGMQLTIEYQISQ